MEKSNGKIEALTPQELEDLARKGKRDYMKKYREENKEVLNAKRDLSFAKKALKGTGKQLNDLTDEEIAELARSEKQKYDKKYRQKNKAKFNAYYQEYRQKNKTKLKENQLRHFARRALEARQSELEEENVETYDNDHLKLVPTESDINVFVSNVLEENEKTERCTIEIEVTMDFEKGTSTSEIADFITNKLISGIQKSEEEAKR